MFIKIANGFLLPATATRRTGRAVSNVTFFLAKANLVGHLERMMSGVFDGTPVPKFHSRKQNIDKIKKNEVRNKIIGLATASAILIRGLITALRGDELAGRCVRPFRVLH